MEGIYEKWTKDSNVKSTKKKILTIMHSIKLSAFIFSQ